MNTLDWSSAVRLLRCPVCRGAIRLEGRALRCSQGHTFDLARDGYVNLLAPGRSAPRLAGDSPEMLRARRAFLERGHYQPLSDALNAAVVAQLIPGRLSASAAPESRDLATPGAGDTHVAPRAGAATASGDPLGVLDAGCGEGYYLGRLSVHVDAALRDAEVTVPLVGMDIAKEAARLAARRYLTVRFVVADVNAPLPFADASMAVVMDIFAPRNSAEFARVLAPGGLLLVGLPAPEHLAELRAHVPMLGIEPDKVERVVERLGADFTPAGHSRIIYPLALSGADAALALGMSPSARHLAPDEVAALAARERAPATAAFELLAFTRRE